MGFPYCSNTDINGQAVEELIKDSTYPSNSTPLTFSTKITKSTLIIECENIELHCNQLDIIADIPVDKLSQYKNVIIKNPVTGIEYKLLLV